MRKSLFLVMLAIFAAGLMLAPGAIAQTDDQPVVRAVLFFSPTCPHCHEVINKLLIPMVDKYGDRLQILAINITEEQGQQFYQVAVEHYSIPPNRLGVPTLIVNDEVLVGSGEIPDKFPQIVEDGLAGAGIDWPGIPGLAGMVAQVPAEPTAESAQPAAENAAPPANSQPTTAPLTDAPPAPTAPGVTLSENSVPEMAAAESPAPDPVGISLAGLVLGAMLAALAFAALIIIRRGGDLLHAGQAGGPARGWLIPLLGLAGLGVAGYLAYVEITGATAVCGPVGNCNAVQSSPYATILGIPIAVLGLANYAAIIGLWFGYRYANNSLADWSLLALLAITAAGTLFSVYLTALEIFVIHAVCAWCISSAIITTAMLLLVVMSIRPAPARRTVPA